MTGAIAADGSPVELYARLAPMGEPELVHAAAPSGAHILERWLDERRTWLAARPVAGPHPRRR